MVWVKFIIGIFIFVKVASFIFGTIVEIKDSCRTTREYSTSDNYLNAFIVCSIIGIMIILVKLGIFLIS